MTERVIAVLALALFPVSVSAQAPRPAGADVVWHWYGGCAGSDSLVLEVNFDDQPIYATTFPICQVRRSQIKPEPQQRFLVFRFDAVPHRFRAPERGTDPRPITGTIWEVRGEPRAILFGVSFATEDKVLLNTRHEAPARSATRTVRVRGLVITTRPVRK
jgi:hypothetical protein